MATGPAAAPAAYLPLAAELAGVQRGFGTRVILRGVDLTIPAGQFVALLGASGSGKTTLLRLLAGFDAPDGGTVRVARRRTTVFQEPRLMPAWPVWRNVVAGLGSARRMRAQALAALGEVGLESHADAWPGTLSGGEAQRVSLARAIVREPDLLLLDEPFAALDALTRVRMQALVLQLCRRHGPATLLVTHDVDEAITLADRMIVLRDGVVHTDFDLRTSDADYADPVVRVELKRRLFVAIGSHPAAPEGA